MALLAIAAVAAFLLTRDSGGLSSVSPNSVGVIDPSSNKLVAEIQVGRDPQAISTGAGAVWVTNVEDETVERIDPTDLAATTATISVDGYPSDVLAGRDTVWVALGALAKLTSINPEQETRDESDPGARRPVRSTAREPRARRRRRLVRMSRWAGRTLRSPDAHGKKRRGRGGLVGTSSPLLPQFEDVVFGLESLWIVDSETNTVIEVDPLVIQKLRPLNVGQDPRAIAASADSLWVANYEDDTVTRVQIESRGATPDFTEIPVGDGPVDVTFGEGAVWVANQLDGTVTRIDAESGEVVATIEIGNEPQRIAAGEGYVWVTVRAPETDVVDES